MIKHFSAFSQELSDFAKGAFENNWLDVEPREGKRGGAFCAGIRGRKQSRIMLNFDGSFSEVSTMAHELGHGYHNSQVYDETMLNASYPMPVAETASIFCETIITNAALADASKEDAIFILEKSIEGATQVIVDILSRFIFEKMYLTKESRVLFLWTNLKNHGRGPKKKPMVKALIMIICILTCGFVNPTIILLALVFITIPMPSDCFSAKDSMPSINRADLIL